jgi:DNA-binding NtrC family response regulator
VTIEVPPLRERREDIPLLVNNFLKQHLSDSGVPRRLRPGVVEALSHYDWPGNVRELENILERILVLTPGESISVEDLPDMIRAAGGLAPTNGQGNGNRHKTGEQIMIEEALRRFAGDKAKAARFIGWNRQKLYRKMKEYVIPVGYGQTV